MLGGTTVGAGLVLLVPVLILAAGAWHFRWMSDDGFINLRVVREVVTLRPRSRHAGQSQVRLSVPRTVWAAGD